MKRGHLSIAILRSAFNALYIFQRYQNEHFWPQNIKTNLAKKAENSTKISKKIVKICLQFSDRESLLTLLGFFFDSVLATLEPRRI